MTTFRVLAKAFSIVGIIATLFVCGLYAILMFYAGSSAEPELFNGLGFLFLGIALISLVMFIVTMTSLENPSIAIGVLDIIFLSPVAGVFYIIYTSFYNRGY